MICSFISQPYSEDSLIEFDRFLKEKERESEGGDTCEPETLHEYYKLIKQRNVSFM